MTRSRVHHFPKWLLQESFKVHYSPVARPKVTVELIGLLPGNWVSGSGSSIAIAAKEADRKRTPPRPYRRRVPRKDGS